MMSSSPPRAELPRMPSGSLGLVAPEPLVVLDERPLPMAPVCSSCMCCCIASIALGRPMGPMGVGAPDRYVGTLCESDEPGRMPAKDMGSESANEAVRLRIGSTEPLPLIGEKGVCVGLCICPRLWPVGVLDSIPSPGVLLLISGLPTLRAGEDSGAALRLSEARLFVMPPMPGAPRLGDCRLELMLPLLPNMPLFCKPFESVGDRRLSSPACWPYTAPIGDWAAPNPGGEGCFS